MAKRKSKKHSIHNKNSNKINIVIHNSEKHYKKRKSRRHDIKGISHNLGQHVQNLPQYTSTVQLGPQQPDQSDLVNQVMHSNNFIKKQNLLLEDAAAEQQHHNPLIQQAIQDAHKPTKLSILNDIHALGGKVKHNKGSHNVAFDDEKQRIAKVKVNPRFINLDKTPVKRKKAMSVPDNHLAAAVHNTVDQAPDMNEILEREDANFQAINDNRELEPHNDQDLNQKAVQQSKPRGRPKGSVNKIVAAIETEIKTTKTRKTKNSSNI